MIQIILILVWVNASGDKQTIAYEFEDVGACYAQATSVMESVASEFEKTGLQSVTAGCMVRLKRTPA